MKAILSDMDGVIYRGKQLVPGAREFVERLLARGTPFLFLTNNSEQTALDLGRKLEALGLPFLGEDHFLTSARTTALFLAQQKPRGSCYVVGGPGLTSELYKVGYSLTESRPDYVVVGKTSSFNYDQLKKAARLIHEGAKFIGTNPDVIDPTEGGFEPAAGSLLAALETATGRKPYVVGKPNALMMLIARKQLGSHASDTVMVGDRMDTDIIGGLEAGMTTVLVLSGVTARDDLAQFPYGPDHVYEHVGQIDLDAL